MVRLSALKRAKVQDVAIISHPRSGLTWIRNLLWEYWSRSEELDPRWTEPKHPMIPFFHDGIGMATTLRKKTARSILEREEPTIYTAHFKKVIFLVRHPLDIMVSNWTRLCLHNMFRGCTLDGFMKCDQLGLEVLLKWWAQWHNWMEAGLWREALVVPYEGMLDDPYTNLADILDLAGVNIEMPIVDAAVRASTFERMKEREEKDGAIFMDQAQFDRRRPGTMSVRNGKVGGWRTALTEEQQGWALEIMERELVGRFRELYL